ncbi:hypothetical protein K469DRAFT_608056 [Zopfia rhizophila CBS 207.26]|uniref:Uncharacterized protein n=1 Tax=Zopfia rhizophila CBS 207.26 TaxID=1314779 RepID=A0A6A6DCL7_9PEZI|nr:hypothetical protein K469DRAFT_608056 [Zopfia rhizophila CBS 207.26]
MSAPHHQGLGEVPICIAIDRSGSTYGRVLRVERGAVQSISRLMSPRNESPVRVLPWCDEVLSPISLPKQAAALERLHSSGGTDPSVLYSSSECLQALSSCGLWFLLTDGEIEDGLVENFALKTAQNGLHGLACVVIVFGSTMRGPPAACNISVGIATYAVAPDCLFLFHDLPTGRLSILQAKGCFKELLPIFEQSYVQPELSKYTKWADLPLISYSNLAEVKIPPARKVSTDELALQDDLVIRMQDLYSGNMDPDLVGDIIKSEDNMKSIILAEATKGSGQHLTDWLLSQEKPLPELTSERPDVGERAQLAVMKLLEALKSGGPNEEIQALRSALRAAHEENWRQFRQTFRAHVTERNMILSHNGLFRQASESSQRVQNCMVSSHSPTTSAFTPQSSASRSQEIDVLFLPKFRRCLDNPRAEFVGPCMLCYQESVLTILLKSPPRISTPNFPRRETHTPLSFPLAMCRFAETDVVSFFLCCDACALYLVRNCISPLSETIVGALCLVSLKMNESSWLEALDSAFNGRFRMLDLPTVFISILDKMMLDNKFRNATEEHKSLYHRALQWAKGELSEIAEASETLGPSTSRSRGRGNRQGLGERTLSLRTVISNRALFDPGEATNTDISMLRYPIDGFPVLIRLLQDQGTTQEELQKHIFQRLVFHITEIYLPTLNDNFNGQRYDLPGILHRLGSQSATSEPHLPSHAIATSISIEDLLGCGLLAFATLESIRGIDEFGDVEKRIGPATAVYLHALSAYGRDFSSPTDFFNAFKTSQWLKKVVHTPLAISEGLSADLALQIPDRTLES